MAEQFEMVEGQEAPPEAVQPQDAAGAEIPGETEQEEAEPSTVDPDGERPKGRAEQRIDELTRKRREAEEQAAYWRGRAEAAATAPVSEAAKLAAQPTGAPKVEDFDTDEAYQDARLEYAAEQGAAKGAATAKREFQEERQKELVKEKAEAREKAIGTELMDKAQDAGAYASDTMLDAAGDQVKEVVEVLVADPAESQRIGALPHVQQAAAIGEIKARLKAGPPPKKTTNAPSPPSGIPGGGGSPGKKTIHDMSPQEQRAQWKKEALEKRGLKP